MSAPLAAPITRFDYRVRIAAALLRSAPRAEHLRVAGMASTSAAAAWPFAGALYPLVAIPALLALAALIRHHLDGLGPRRDALAAAGANPADALVIQVAGPLGATGVGAFAGIVAAIAVERPAVHAVGPLAVGTVAALLIRRTWLGAPALAAGSLGALVTAVLIGATTHPAAPMNQPRTRLGSAPAADAIHTAATSPWSAAWPTALVAVLVLAATQAAIAKREALRRLARRMAAAAKRRLIARSSA